MEALRKFGGFSALYMAISHLAGMMIFLVILNYASITDPAQIVALNVENQLLIFSTNLLMYVFFGFFLITLSLALYDRLKAGAPAIMQAATAVGVIWAGSLIACGMVSNAGLASVATLYGQDPAQAALTWRGIEAVTIGLGNGNGEILGGLWVLLVSLAALRAGGLPKGLSILGLAAGAAGIVSIIPGLTGTLVGLFALCQIAWFIGLGIVLLRRNADKAA